MRNFRKSDSVQLYDPGADLFIRAEQPLKMALNALLELQSQLNVVDVSDALRDRDVLTDLSMDMDALAACADACKFAAQHFSQAAELSELGHELILQGMDEEERLERRSNEVDEAEEFERSYFPRR
jgi:hypothetical protein